MEREKQPNAEYGGVTLREKPWTDRELLKEKYVDERMSSAEIADEWDCAQSTVLGWMKRHGIDTRDASAAISMSYGNHPNEVPMQVKQTGAVRWNYAYKGEKRTVFVHRLLAVALWGFEAVKDNVVHHRNEVRWDNRPANLELMRHSEHSSHHKKLNYHDRLRIVEMYREGASGYTLAPIFGVDPTAIIDAVHEFDPSLVRSNGGWTKAGGAA